ncbi:beta-galactosidase [Mucilaginibacter sp.]|uniref:beta-galactosidase n=1 Tax=Mucilaginibacter sp. TaxID=1882438 RepID=UPI0026314219|nr:beta-galactosidase [Mucilaginibacter sp.]MDB4925846.1 hypothetical protein [Mucilaginibacter sp.]
MRNILFVILLAIAIKTSAQSGVGTPSRNDHIFPSSPKAKPYIDYDARGFLINGKRTFITSAGMEYARVPRALWHDRLLRLKRAGFNAIEMYTFWNFHEPKEGQFNFTGDHDLNAFLKMIKDMDMYAIVRIGPYYCGEWNMGGFPIWLKFKPGLRVREDNLKFLSAVDKFFDKLMPIVTHNQINHGGSVIMVQLENEHRAAWGTVTPNNYFRHLINKTISLGLEVPYFFSGLHSGNDPAGDVSNLDDPKRPNPWFSTEYWGVWYLNYGPQEQDSTLYDRRTWKIIAHGGNGYNVYMAHGGTNFDYNNDRDNAASYDYGASVGQAGDLRPLYYSFKRANWFARSFQSILANSINADDGKPTVSDTAIKITARKSPAGTIAFLDNADSVAHQFKLHPPTNGTVKTSAEIKLAPGEIMPVVHDYQLTPQVKLAWAPTRIYGIISQENTTTILLYGDAGSSAQLYFNMPKDAKIIKGASNFKMVDDIMSFNAKIGSSPLAYNFEAGGQRIRIITVNNVLASHSWFAETGGQTHIVIGPDYAADLIGKNNKLSLLIEHPWADKSTSPTWIFKPTGAVIKINQKPQTAQHIVKLKLGVWQVKDASSAALPGYDDSGWKQSDNPLQMGADGDITANAWYRKKIKVAETGNYILKFKNVRDRAELFLDGKRIDTGTVFNKTPTLNLTAGVDHTIAVFAAHDGRNKLIFRVGEIDTIDAKGLSGPVTLQKADGSGPLIAVNKWRMKGGPAPCDSPLERGGGVCPLRTNNTPLQSRRRPHPLSRGEVQKSAVIGSPGEGYAGKAITHTLLQAQNNTHVFSNVPHYYRTTLNLPVLKGSHPIWRVNTTRLSYGSAWVNGHNLGRYPEKIKINGLYIPGCWLKPGVNKLVIYDENGVLPNKVSVEAEVAASRNVQTLHF